MEDTNRNRPIKSKETELVIKNLPTKLIPIQNSFTSALYQIFKRNNANLQQTITETEEEATFPDSS